MNNDVFLILFVAIAALFLILFSVIAAVSSISYKVSTWRRRRNKSNKNNKYFVVYAYDEYGAHEMHLSKNGEFIYALMKDFLSDPEKSHLRGLIDEAELNEGIDITVGWGGYRLHIVLEDS